MSAESDFRNSEFFSEICVHLQYRNFPTFLDPDVFCISFKNFDLKKNFLYQNFRFRNSYAIEERY